MLLTLLECIVLYVILYIMTTNNVSFLKCILTYVIYWNFIFLLGYGFHISYFLITFLAYALIGFGVNYILRIINDKWGMPGFIIVGIVTQIIAELLLSGLLSIVG